MLWLAQAEPNVHWMTYVYPYLPLVGTVIAAFIAMGHWKRQQYLRQRHELAFRMIHASIMLREEFWRARQMLMTGGEIDVFKKKYDITEEQVGVIDHNGGNAFQRIGLMGRLWDLQSVYVDLRAIAFEIESLLGEQYRDCLDPIDELFREFRMSVSLYLDTEHKATLDREARTKLDRIVYGSRELETDIFGGGFEAEISSLIKKLRVFLMKK